jgi:uncharacterized protein
MSETVTEQAPAPVPVVREPFIRRLSPAAFVTLSLIGVFILYQVIAGGLMLVLAGGEIREDTVTLVRWSTLIGQLLFLLVPTLILTHLRYGSLREPLRLRWPDPVQLVVVLAGVFAFQQVMQGYLLLQEAIPLPATLERIIEPIKRMMETMYRLLLVSRNPGELVLVIVTVAVVPALSEEILFRGLVQTDLERIMGGWKSAVIAGVIFGLYHVNPFSLVPIVGLGVVFGLIVHRSGTIVLAMAAHFMNNLLATVALSMNLDDDFLVTAPQGGAGALEIALNTAVFAVVFVALMYYFVRITKPSVPALS